MSDTKDPIDTAIGKTLDAEDAESLTANFRLTDGRAVLINVPIDFGPDEFETCVGILMQLRVASDQRKALLEEKARGGLVLPDRPKLQALDGRKLT